METILIVDDEKNYPPILSAILEEEGFETLTANSGQEALSIIIGSDIDLVLTDMIMPEEMTGRQLIERLLAEKPNLKVVCSSGYAEEATGADMLSLAPFQLRKPYNPQQLLDTVRRCLDGALGEAREPGERR